MRRLTIILVLALLTLAAITDTDFRWHNFDEAQKLYPEPDLENYPIREALVEYTHRQDLVSHPWYIYVLGDNGNIIGYYVGKTAPQSTCNFLSSTQDLVDIDEEPDQVLTAPSLDGVFYGGAGASSACAMSFFFDYESNALVMVPSVRLFVTDQPLRIEADPIEIQ